ncbi:MAG: AarF/ABC1/UbiB kinase family protein [Gammaproteobacteria bacterium]|nr:AarF/ABC1/UbiB kinase family protein [Gammaproteobacteria bacterium]MDH3971178.1 AarF/ABC1/UbiB kinase family protein [Gammaproteobacteria bacterium]
MRKTQSPASPVPRGRFERLAHLGGLAGRVAGGMLAEGIRQVAQGNLPRASDLILTPANAQRVADKLSELRGAAMKVGQLLSMDAGDILPAELTSILASLRADARPMPMSEVVAVMQQSFGQGWENHFKRFSFTPLAAASIGQVHAALSQGGRPLALKIQYPGIRQSIDSDVDNVATLLNVSRLLPDGLDLQPLLQEAKRQLHEEADYLLEAGHLQRFAVALEDTPELLVPAVDEGLTRENILAMDLLEGEPIESLTTASQATRDRVVGLLLELLFRELFEFGMIQTDPNFANYLYIPATRQLGLLDFGATRRYPATVIEAYRGLLKSALREDHEAMSESAQAIGYFKGETHAHQRAAVMQLFILATEPARTRGCFDFGASDLAVRIRDAGMALSFQQGYWHTPPADAIFLHRKLGGLYLLAARLRAKIAVGAILERYL